ncbi:MAG: glycosyltransferase family 4 protein [Actinobacteria bacterium]|nr:glycosyltransferase family 4 protein [Actinomycetota bacterium]
MYPSRERPELGVFVRDQLDALCRIEPPVDAELFAFAPGGALSYLRAIRRLRRHLKTHEYDVVHAHYGLTGWVAKLAGAAPLIVTYHGTDLRHEKVGPWSKRLAARIDQAAVVSDDLGELLDGVKLRRPAAVMPCGVNLGRVHPMLRQEAREHLALDPEGSYVLFPADPSRPEKRHDRATVLLKEFSDVELLTLGGVDPNDVSAYMCAADAVLVPSEYEGFGLATLEALACGVPVIATPTGIAPEALDGVAGAYCLPFDLGTWRETLAAILDDPDPHVSGSARAAEYSSDAMALRALAVYESIAEERR